VDLYRPRVYLLAAATKTPLQVPVMTLNTKVPFGANFRLDYIAVWYPQSAIAGVRVSPDLTFTLLNTRGTAHTAPPIAFQDMTTPAGGDKLRRPQGLRIDFPPGAFITLQITGMNAGPVPAVVSVTYIGQLGWAQR